MPAIVERLTYTGTLRCDAVRKMSLEDLGRPIPDDFLAQSQPTIGHHLQALVFHEGVSRRSAGGVAPSARSASGAMGRSSGRSVKGIMAASDDNQDRI